MKKDEFADKLLSKIDRKFIIYHFENNNVTKKEDILNFSIGYIITKTIEVLKENGIIDKE